MIRFNTSLSLILFLTILIAGCSGGSTPTMPDSQVSEGIDSQNNPTQKTSDSHQSWGAFDVFLDVDNLAATIEPAQRDSLFHVDVTNMLTPPNCADCLQVQIIGYNPVAHIAGIRITLRNPSSLAGYDVRTIFLNYDLKEFPGVDGYTDIWSPSSERLPYYNFAIEHPDRMFGAHEIHIREFGVYVPPGASGYVTIGVDASWPGQVEEPFEVEALASSWLINDDDDTTKIIAYVYDHQENIEYVTADLAPLGGEVEELFDDGEHSDGEADDGIYCVKKIDTTVPHGIYDIWVSCKSEDSDIITYQIVKITVSDVDPFAKGDPDYERIYDMTQVKRIDVLIPPENWAAMQQDLLEQVELPWDERDFNYFDCSVYFEGVGWHHVGLRYKGNSSLDAPYRAGIKKLPFKLDFDEFEDTYPETKNHRFWGVKQLSLANGFKDPSLLREILTYDLLRDFGVYAGHSAHIRLFIDFGQGPTYFGLYTSNEQVDERFLDDKFGDDNGNLYKPEGPGADLTFFNQDSFEKKTNEDEEDWSDVINLIDVLNASYPTPEDFAIAIESVFDVDSFLNWLVVNSALCNLDSFALMTHNYYLYNNPDDGKFYFIPWDNNESFGAFMGPLTPETMPEWDILNPYFGNKPLIQNILDVPAYMDDYQLRVRSFVDGLMSEPLINADIDTAHNVARPFVIGPDGEFPPYTMLRHQEEYDINVVFDVPPFGPNRTLGLKSFLADRRAYINTVIP